MTLRQATRRLFAVAAVAYCCAGVWAGEAFRYREGAYQQGRLQYLEGLPVLRVQGTPEQMGEQAAMLSAEAAKDLLEFPKDLLALLGLGKQWARLGQAGQLLLPQVPPDHLRELNAFARTAGLDRDLMLGVNTLVDVYRGAFGCSSLIIEPERSATKAPLFGRNLDFYSLGRLHRYSLVTVYRPAGKRAFVSIGFPGMLGCLSGMNDAGLALAVHEVFLSRDKAAIFNPQGVPYTFCLRRILEECASVPEAERLLRSVPRTTLFSLVLCDTQTGAVLEATPKSVVLRGPVDGICACANHFCSEELGTWALAIRYNMLRRIASKSIISLEDVARMLHQVNQGPLTLQTMVFEPAALRLHLAIGSCPASALPLRRLDLATLLGSKPAR